VARWAAGNPKFRSSTALSGIKDLKWFCYPFKSGISVHLVELPAWRDRGHAGRLRDGKSSRHVAGAFLYVYIGTAARMRWSARQTARSLFINSF